MSSLPRVASSFTFLDFYLLRYIEPEQLRLGTTYTCKGKGKVALYF